MSQPSTTIGTPTIFDPEISEVVPDAEISEVIASLNITSQFETPNITGWKLVDGWFAEYPPSIGMNRFLYLNKSQKFIAN